MSYVGDLSTHPLRLRLSFRSLEMTGFPLDFVFDRDDGELAGKKKGGSNSTMHEALSDSDPLSLRF